MPNHKNKHHRKHKRRNNNHNDDDDDDVAISVDDSRAAKTYEVKHSDIFGRYLVCSRDMSACEIIIQQKPLVIGPIANCPNVPVCLNCYRPLGSMSGCPKCPDCNFPLCGTDDCTACDHTKDECAFFKENKLAQYLHRDGDMEELQHDYEAIIILRCLMLKTLSEQLWQKLNEMESHCEIRRNIPALWNRNQNVIVNRIRERWNLSQFSEEEVHKMCGILEVNCFEVGGGQSSASARALYPEAYLMCHNCVPNTNHTDNPSTHELIVRTTKALKKGDIITLSYAYTLQGTLKRRQHLHEAKFFWCSCERCASNDELGTHASTLLCECTGFILSTNPLDENAEWRCQKCSFTLTALFVLNLVTKLYDELDALGGNDINQIEMFTRKYAKALHENHYIFLSAKHSLCQLYGKIDGFLINELSVEQLKCKEHYCRELMEVIDVLEPGSSRLRGVILYELHAPIMLQISREYQMGLIKNSNFRRKLKEVLKVLEKSHEILKYEPMGSSEYEMAVAAKSALNSISSQ